jgi:hypothetical protein
MEFTQTHIATLIPENNYTVVNTLNNREGYALELDKQYDVTISVTGDFRDKMVAPYEIKIKWRI